MLDEYFFYSYMSSSYCSLYVRKFPGKAWYEEWRNQQFDLHVLVSTAQSPSVLSV